MSITKIIGVPYDNIVKISGIPKGSITKIGGVPTPPSVTCGTVSLGYQEGPPVATVCNQPQSNYEYDRTNNILYNENSCGGELAPVGFYSNRREIFFWDGISLQKIGSCASYPQFSNLINLVDNSTSYPFISVQYSNQQNGITGTFRFNYSAYTGLELYCKVSTSEEYPFNGDYSSDPPKFMTPPFFFVEPAGSTYETIIYVQNGDYITLGYTSFDVPPDVTMTVGVEVDMGGGIWQEIGSFDCTNVLSL